MIILGNTVPDDRGGSQPKLIIIVVILGAHPEHSHGHGHSYGKYSDDVISKSWFLTPLPPPLLINGLLLYSLIILPKKQKRKSAKPNKSV